MPGVTDAKYARVETDGRRLRQFAYRAEGADVRLDIERAPDRPGHRHFHVLFSTAPPPDRRRCAGRRSRGKLAPTGHKPRPGDRHVTPAKEEP